MDNLEIKHIKNKLGVKVGRPSGQNLEHDISHNIKHSEKMMLISLIFASLLIGANAVEFIVQFKQDFTFDSFFSKYYQKNSIDDVSAALNLGIKSFELGQFKGIMGDFNVDMIKALYYDKNIASISIDRELVLAEVQENAPSHLARLSQKESLKKNRE